MNCSSDFKIFANSWPSASNFKSFSRSLEQFFLTVGQNNFGNKVPNDTLLRVHLLEVKFTFKGIPNLTFGGPGYLKN